MSTALDALAAATESVRAQTLVATKPTATTAPAQADAAAANAAAAATATSAAALGYMTAAGTWPSAGQAPTQLQFGMAHNAAAEANAAAAAAAAAAAMGRASYMHLDRRFYPPVPYATAGAEFAAAAGPSAEYLAAAGYMAPGFPSGYGYTHLAVPQPAAAYGALSSHSSPMLPSAVLNRPPSGMDGNGLTAMNLSSPQISIMHDGGRAAGIKQESRPPTPPLASYVSVIENASARQFQANQLIHANL